MCLPKVTTQLSPFLHSFALICTWKACIFKLFLGEAPQTPQQGGNPPRAPPVHAFGVRTTRLCWVEGHLQCPKADIWTPSYVFLAKSLEYNLHIITICKVYILKWMSHSNVIFTYSKLNTDLSRANTFFMLSDCNNYVNELLLVWHVMEVLNVLGKCCNVVHWFLGTSYLAQMVAKWTSSSTALAQLLQNLWPAGSTMPAS